MKTNENANVSHFGTCCTTAGAGWVWPAVGQGHSGGEDGLAPILRPPSSDQSRALINALTAADEVLIPLQCEFFAMEGLAQILAVIDQVKEGENPRLELAGVTRSAGRTSVD